MYTVDGSLHTRKDLQLVKGNVIKAPTKTKAQQKQRDIQDKIGKSLNNPEEQDLVGTRTKNETNSDIYIFKEYTQYIHDIYMVYTVMSTYTRNILCIYHAYT